MFVCIIWWHSHNIQLLSYSYRTCSVWLATYREWSRRVWRAKWSAAEQPWRECRTMFRGPSEVLYPRSNSTWDQLVWILSFLKRSEMCVLLPSYFSHTITKRLGEGEKKILDCFASAFASSLAIVGWLTPLPFQIIRSADGLEIPSLPFFFFLFSFLASHLIPSFHLVSSLWCKHSWKNGLKLFLFFSHLHFVAFF